MKWYVYLLICSDSRFYCGMTNNLEKRIKTHNAGKGAKFTRGRRPVNLAYYKICKSKSEALKEEHRIKKLDKFGKIKLSIDFFAKKFGVDEN